ncbi:hypothetical protein B5M42_020920 [Paenibacillus athensensis]|uniref:Uncharacterized protein n=1 Tax=Paenibacillus athensensis TaxID=1967502 RepID=A0A4Y8PZL6_9BACL|nr:hypothetical protein [Paenibacillus athensensis]MCD1261267.1 hypothetical protein [Paenibacillus athensensis]
MGSSVRSMIERSFAFAVFLATVTVGLLLLQNGLKTVDLAYMSNRAADYSIHSTLSPIAGDGTVSGAEVLQSIGCITEIGADIIVDGVVYPANLKLEETNLSGIRTSGKYAPTYIRGTHGELQTIIFTSA